MNGKLLTEADPDRTEFAHLKYAPFSADLGAALKDWGDLRIDGYIGGKQVISRTLSGRGVDRKFALLPDDTTLVGDGADTTRVVLRVTDEFDAIRPFAADAIRFELTGPAEIIGDNPFRWSAAREQSGSGHLKCQAKPGSLRTIPTSAYSRLISILSRRRRRWCEVASNFEEHR